MDNRLPNKLNGVTLEWGFPLSDRDRVAVVEAKPMPHPPHILPGVRRHSGEVYFIRREGDGAIKIGWTGSVYGARTSGLQVGSVEVLTLVASIPGTREVERQWHSRFAYAHIRGEWFKPVPDLLAAIKSLT